MWIKWDGGFFQTKINPDDLVLYLTKDIVECEKHDDWREVESGTLDIETGKFLIVLKKPLYKIPQRLLDLIDPSAVNGGSRVIMLCSDGSWAVKDLKRGVDHLPVELWVGKYAAQDNGDYIVRI